MVNAILNGCNGAMGRVITDIVSKDDGIRIVAGVDVNPLKLADYEVYETLDQCPAADVVIDFSSAKATDGVVAYCEKTKTPVVLCTTGLSEEQLERVKALGETTAVLRSANMSLGVNLLFKILKQAAPVLAEAGFDIEILEKHHNQKVDAPSGTALALADAVNESLGNEYHYKYDRTAERVKRDKKEIGIQAIRGGSIVGEHDVIFAGQDEVVTFQHTAYSKAIFARRSPGSQIPGRKSSGHVRHGRCDRLIHILLSFVHTKAERKEDFLLWKRSDGSLLALCWLLLSVRPLPAEEMIPMEAPQDKAPDGRSLPRLPEAGPQRRCPDLGHRR